MGFRARNPTTGEIVEAPPWTSAAAIENALESAHRALRQGSCAGPRRGFDRRAKRLTAIAERLRSTADSHARIMAGEMGKPVAEGRAEIEKCASVCDYYAEHGAQFLAAETIVSDASASRVVYRPLGLVLAIMPWNFPYWQVFRCLAPAYMAGNAVVLKHAPNVPGCASAIQALLDDTLDDDRDLFQTLFIDEDTIARVIADPRIRAVTLTGSTRAGRAVAALAGRHLKKTLLELGGSDPFVVLDDADIEAAAEAAVTSRLINAGQSCIAAKRLVVVAAVRDRFTTQVVEKMAAARMGHPFDDDVTLGPMARHDLRDTLHTQVQRSVAAGASTLLGGGVPEGPGAFYPATVLDNVAPGMPAYDEELFGPVAAIVPVADETEAIRVANDTAYGLGATIFTHDVERGERLASEHLDAGSCFVNSFVRSDPRLPFGGTKDSGYGRELGRHGILELVQTKTVWIA